MIWKQGDAWRSRIHRVRSSNYLLLLSNSARRPPTGTLILKARPRQHCDKLTWLFSICRRRLSDCCCCCTDPCDLKAKKRLPPFFDCHLATLQSSSLGGVHMSPTTLSTRYVPWGLHMKWGRCDPGRMDMNSLYVEPFVYRNLEVLRMEIGQFGSSGAVNSIHCPLRLTSRLYILLN